MVFTKLLDAGHLKIYTHTVYLELTVKNKVSSCVSFLVSLFPHVFYNSCCSLKVFCRLESSRSGAISKTNKQSKQLIYTHFQTDVTSRWCLLVGKHFPWMFFSSFQDLTKKCVRESAMYCQANCSTLLRGPSKTLTSCMAYQVLGHTM